MGRTVRQPLADTGQVPDMRRRLPLPVAPALRPPPNSARQLRTISDYLYPVIQCTIRNQLLITYIIL